jgi:hypothetical protein
VFWIVAAGTEKSRQLHYSSCSGGEDPLSAKKPLFQAEGKVLACLASIPP